MSFLQLGARHLRSQIRCSRLGPVAQATPKRFSRWFPLDCRPLSQLALLSPIGRRIKAIVQSALFHRSFPRPVNCTITITGAIVSATQRVCHRQPDRTDLGLDDLGSVPLQAARWNGVGCHRSSTSRGNSGQRSDRCLCRHRCLQSAAAPPSVPDPTQRNPSSANTGNW